MLITLTPITTILFRRPEGGASKLEVATRIANIINLKAVLVDRETCNFVNSATEEEEGICANDDLKPFVRG